MIESAGEQWVITIRPERGPVPSDVRIRRWLKQGLRCFGLRCSVLDLPAEVRALQLRLAVMNEENEHLRQLVSSLADRCAGQAELLSKRAERRDSA